MVCSPLFVISSLTIVSKRVVGYSPDEIGFLCSGLKSFLLNVFVEYKRYERKIKRNNRGRR